MKWKAYFIATLCCLLLAACNAPTLPARGPKAPTQAELASAEYGVMPREEQNAQIRATMETLLKDPESARYRFSPPEKHWIRQSELNADVKASAFGQSHLFGWRVDFGLNAKNGFGGYSGEKPYRAFFENGELRGIFKGDELLGHRIWLLVAAVNQGNEEAIHSSTRHATD